MGVPARNNVFAKGCGTGILRVPMVSFFDIFEGECPHEPPSRRAEEWFQVSLRSTGGQASACPGRADARPPGGGRHPVTFTFNAHFTLNFRDEDARSDCAHTKHASTRQPLSLAYNLRLTLTQNAERRLRRLSRKRLAYHLHRSKLSHLHPVRNAGSEQLVRGRGGTGAGEIDHKRRVA